VKYEKSSVVERSDEVFAAPVRIDKASPPEPPSEAARSRASYDIRSSDDYAIDALAEDRLSEVKQLSLDFG